MLDKICACNAVYKKCKRETLMMRTWDQKLLIECCWNANHVRVTVRLIGTMYHWKTSN